MSWFGITPFFAAICLIFLVGKISSDVQSKHRRTLTTHKYGRCCSQPLSHFTVMPATRELLIFSFPLRNLFQKEKKDRNAHLHFNSHVVRRGKPGELNWQRFIVRCTEYPQAQCVYLGQSNFLRVKPEFMLEEAASMELHHFNRQGKSKQTNMAPGCMGRCLGSGTNAGSWPHLLFLTCHLPFPCPEMLPSILLLALPPSQTPHWLGTTGTNLPRWG